MNLQPKARFLKTDAAKKHQDLVKSDSFQDALTVALAEMELNMPRGDNVAQSFDCHSQMIGARTFIHTFLNLAEVTPPTKKPDQSLNYKNS